MSFSHERECSNCGSMSGSHRKACWRCSTVFPDVDDPCPAPASDQVPHDGRTTGTIKRFTPGDEYGFISCPELPGDIWFHKTSISGNYKGLRIGDTVRFRPISNRGQLRVTDVEVVRLGQRDFRDPSNVTGGVIVGATVGAVLGPVGSVIGAILGGVIGSNRSEKVSTCLHCNSVGYATGEGNGRTGYRCSGCGHRWSQRG